MAAQIISATEMNRSLSDILNRVYYQGQVFEIIRGKEIVAKIVPMAIRKKSLKTSELQVLLENLPSLDIEDKADFKKEVEKMRSHMHFEENPWD